MYFLPKLIESILTLQLTNRSSSIFAQNECERAEIFFVTL